MRFFKLLCRVFGIALMVALVILGSVAYGITWGYDQGYDDGVGNGAIMMGNLFQNMCDKGTKLPDDNNGFYYCGRAKSL